MLNFEEVDVTENEFILLGLTTIITPTKPTITAAHLLKPTFSFKKIKAKIVTKKGLVIKNV